MKIPYQKGESLSSTIYAQSRNVRLASFPHHNAEAGEVLEEGPGRELAT